MRLHRFYVNTPISGDTFDIDDRDLVRQWKNVFRYNVGSQVIIFDGSGSDYLCIISSLRNLGATLSVLRKTENTHVPKRNIWLCLGITKKDTIELVVQKATELGVKHVIPVLCERSEKKNINKERLEKITLEASEQSGRGDIVKIYEKTNLKDLLKKDLLPNRVVYLDPKGQGIHTFLENDVKDLAVFVGPEGGWSEDEEKIFKEFNILSISLGKQVLRSETSAIAVASLLLI